MIHTWNTRLLPFFSILLFCSGTIQAQQIPLYNSAELIEKGVKEHDEGHYKKALEWYRKVPEGDTNYLWSVYEQSLTLVADSSYQEAITMARKALREGYNDRRQLMLNIANANDELGKEAEAMQIYDSCALLYPHDYRPYYERAVLYFKKENLPAAVQMLQQSLMRNPYHYRSHYMLGNIYLLEGRLTETMMALQASLLCTNERTLAEGPIGLMNSVAVQTDEVAGLYSDKKQEYAHAIYDEIDEIIHAKLALNKGYTLKTSVDDNIIRQIQVMMEKLRYDSKDTTFSMQYYVPLLKTIYDQDQLEAYILLLFSEYGIESIDKMAAARKGKTRLEEVRGLVFPYLASITATRELNYTRRQTAPEIYHRYPQEKLLIVGKYADKTNKKFSEEKVQFFSEETLAGEGRYDAAGEKDGTWNYYYANGKPRLKEQYRNGTLNGESISWYRNGNIEYRLQYNAEGIATERYNYEYNGRPLSTGILKGKDEYEVTYYHPNGMVMRVLRLVNDKIKDGSYTMLHPNGKVSKELIYKNGMLDGPCKIYYDNGNLKESYNCKEDKIEGLYQSLNPEGKPSAKYNYAGGERDGLSEDFYEDGNPSMKIHFHNGKEEGEASYYDRAGKLYGKVNYKEGEVIAARFTDPEGKVVLEKEGAGGISPMEYYNCYGIKGGNIPISDKGAVHGKASYYYPSGVLKEETEFKEDAQDGNSVAYHKNGKPSTRCHYTKGEEDGYYQYYSSNGILRSEGWQQNGSSEGVWHNYSENGKLSREFFLINGEMNGPEKNYEVNGKLDYVNIFDYGMIVGMIQYDSTGKVIRETTFDQGNGTYQMLYLNGNPGLQCALKNGDLNGPYTIQSPDKKLMEKGTYVAGKRDGECVTYYANGKLRLKGNYKNGQRTGLWTAYDPSGTVENETAYGDGVLQGSDLFYAGGMLRYATGYYNDEKNGPMTIYGEDKKIAGVLHFDMGALTGYTYEGKDGKLLPVIPVIKGTAAIRTFYANGAKALEFNFVSNCNEGTQKLYFSNGQLAEEKTFVADNYNGAYKRFNPDGSKLIEVQFSNDVQQGPELKYDQKGKLLSSVNYTDGEPNGPAQLIDGNGKSMIDLWYYYGTLEQH